MKAVIISHSYLNPEYQKNILVLSTFLDVRCILPRRGSILMFDDYEFKNVHDLDEVFYAYRPFYLSKAQYVLCSLTLGLRRFAPDIINVEYHPWSLIFFQVLLCRWIFRSKSKIVCTIKKNTFHCRPGVFGKIKNWVARLSLKWVDHFIVASTMASELYKKEFLISPDKISVCHHLGVDLSSFSPIKDVCSKDVESDRTVVVGYCGRLDKDKGVQDLIEAMYLVKQSVKRTILLKLLGCGAYCDFLDDELRRESRKNKWLELLPPIPNADVPWFLRTLDIFVLPSRVLIDHQEHDAHVLLEAMACGVACIGTKAGIIPEILGNGNGLLVSPQCPEELFEALNLLIHDSGKRRELSINGRNISVNEFSLSAIAKQKSMIFNGVINECL